MDRQACQSISNYKTQSFRSINHKTAVLNAFSQSGVPRNNYSLFRTIFFLLNLVRRLVLTKSVYFIQPSPVSSLLEGARRDGCICGLQVALLIYSSTLGPRLSCVCTCINNSCFAVVIISFRIYLLLKIKIHLLK